MTVISAPSTIAPRPSRVREREAVEMLRDGSLHELGQCAHAVTERMHPEPYRTYVVDRNINYANFCTARCIFCDFKADPPDQPSGRKDLPPGYVLSFDQIGRKIDELIAIGGTQILMQGGLVPPEILEFEWYERLLRFIKGTFPTIHIHAFSPPEIFALAEVFEMTIQTVLRRLQDAGLDSIPGGGRGDPG